MQAAVHATLTGDFPGLRQPPSWSSMITGRERGAGRNSRHAHSLARRSAQCSPADFAGMENGKTKAAQGHIRTTASTASWGNDFQATRICETLSKKNHAAHVSKRVFALPRGCMRFVLELQQKQAGFASAAFDCGSCSRIRADALHRSSE